MLRLSSFKMPPDITYISKQCVYCLLLIVLAQIHYPASAEIDREVGIVIVCNIKTYP